MVKVNVLSEMLMYNRGVTSTIYLRCWCRHGCAVSKIIPNSDKICEDHPLTSFGKLPFVSDWVAFDFDAQIWVARKIRFETIALRISAQCIGLFHLFFLQLLNFLFSPM
mgnify:CR=1 FL=1